MKYFGLKLGQDLENRAAHPYQNFQGVPPPPPGFVVKFNARTFTLCNYLKSAASQNLIY